MFRTGRLGVEPGRVGSRRPAPPSEGNADEFSLPASQPEDYAELDDDGELPF